VGDPEAAFVGEIAHGAGFRRDGFSESVEGMRPAGRGEVGEDFGAVGQVHEGASDAGLVEVAVTEFEQARVLLAAFPAEGFEPPESALDLVLVAIVSRDEERRAGCAHAVEVAERSPAPRTAGNLHQAVKEKKRAAETFVI